MISAILPSFWVPSADQTEEEAMPNPVVHFEIIAPDAAKLRKFYGDTFGWKINADNPMNYGIVDTGTPGQGIGGGIAAPMQGGHANLTFYIEVANIDAVLQKISAAGGKTLMPKMTVPPNGPTIAQFADPAGHRVGLIEAGSMG
jgi:uncharacterized protein